jgi:hypothetical protein
MHVLKGKGIEKMGGVNGQKKITTQTNLKPFIESP